MTDERTDIDGQTDQAMTIGRKNERLHERANGRTDGQSDQSDHVVDLDVDLVDVDLVDVDLDDQKYDFCLSRTDLHIVDGLNADGLKHCGRT